MTQAKPEGRGERRKRETRERLLQAAFRLMADRGADAVTIAEITEAADVGFGSFYNHFDSKEAIGAAVIDAVFEGFADALDRQVASLGDPAEIVAVSVRHTVSRAAREPQWGRLLVREGWSPKALSHGLGARLARDVERGRVAGRFQVDDPLVGLLAAGGTVLAAVALVSSADVVLGPGGVGVALDALPERAAGAVLRGLGLVPDDARDVAQRPLPAGADGETNSG